MQTLPRIHPASPCPLPPDGARKIHDRWHLMLKSVFPALILLALWMFHAMPCPAGAESRRLFRIGTGGVTGVYYPIGKLIAEGLTPLPVEENETSGDKVSGVPGIIGVAQNSAGSIENIRAVVSGQIEAGLVQADTAAWAFESVHAFAGDSSGRAVRAVASLYPELLQIVTRQDADIRNVGDFRGKRISIDEPGSGTLSVMRILLSAYGLSESDFFPVYLKPVFTQDKMTRNDIQGFALVAGVPTKAVTQLADIGLFMVPVDAATASGIHARYPFLVPGEIPSGKYPGIAQTSTLKVYALLVVSIDASETLIHQVTAALWSQRTLSLLEKGHPQGKEISAKTALTGLSIPLHPGAERYYREKNMLSTEKR